MDGDGSLLVATNFVRDSLASGMDATQNTIPLVSSSLFPDPAGATYFVVVDAPTTGSHEICGYTGKSGNTLTGVVRGQRGTIGVTHSSGIIVEQNIVDAYHEFVKAAIVAVQTKVGINGSATTSTHDYKLATITGSDQSAGVTATQTLTNKTLTTPTINGGTHTAITGLGIRDTSAAFDVTLTMTSTSAALTAGRTITQDVGNVAHTVQWGTTANTITFPSVASDTVVMLAAAQTLTSKTLSSPTLSGTVSGTPTWASNQTITLGTAAQPNVTSLGVLTALGINGDLTFSGASRRIIAGTTDFAVRDNGNANNNLLITDAGDVSVRARFLILAAASKIVGGATSLSVRDNADANDNLLITNAGDVLSRAALKAGTTLFKAGAQILNEFNAGDSGTAKTIDWNSGDSQRVRLTGNVTFTLSNPVVGMYYTLRILQDATGGRTIVWPASVKHPNGVTPVQTTTLSTTDVWTLYWDGTNYYSGIQQNYSAAN